MAALAVSIGCHARGRAVECWDSQAHAIHLKVCRYEILPRLFLAGYQVVLTVEGRGESREIMVWEVDDPIPIQRQQIGFVTDRVAYAFGNARYVVTTDGGGAWSSWDAADGLPLDRPQIESVSLGTDGRGTMRVHHRAHSGTEYVELRTSDYGAHWSK
jgi:hypothetical protein